MSRARELSFALSSKMCGHLQSGAGGTGLTGSSVPFTLNLLFLQMLNCFFQSLYVSLRGHHLLIAI